MSTNPADPALERLNYFNGQRLAAADFRAEQGHHLAMRRVLNRSLYSAGIVTGLEVEPDKADVHRVIVRDGLAFDHLGREIFVPVDVSVLVMGTPSETPGVVFGNLLVVSYRETSRFPSQNRCVVSAASRPCSGDLAWGAPTRVTADAVFEVVDAWPAAHSGKIVLAQIELSKSCAVVRASPGVRKYAVPVKAGKTRVISIAGEHDIAPENPKLLRFHIADGLPERAELYLKGGKFSSLWYSELAKHGHVLNLEVAGNEWRVDFSHTHSLEGEMAEGGKHRHSYHKENAGDVGGVKHSNGPYSNDNNGIVVGENDTANAITSSGAHTHDLSSVTFGPAVPSSVTIVPDFSASNIEESGMEPGVRPGQRAYDYFKEVKVKLDGTPVTEKILLQLPTLTQLGVGASTTPESEPFVTEGTTAIDLAILGVDLLPGAHSLEFVVPPGQGGGKLYFELYID